MNDTNPLPTLQPETRAAILASAAVVSICKHTLECVAGAGRIITLRCPVCKYELNVFGDHLRHETPRLQLDDEQHAKISAAFDSAWNSLVAIAGTLQILMSGGVSLEYMQSELVDRIGKLGSYRDALERLRALLDLPEAAPLVAEDDDPDWLSPTILDRRPQGEPTQELDELKMADEDTAEVEKIYVNIFDAGVSRRKLRLEESEVVQ